jgi:hypothetical protein
VDSPLGLWEGEKVGPSVGLLVGSRLGSTLGVFEGTPRGLLRLGFSDGSEDGFGLKKVGPVLGNADAPWLDKTVGISDGNSFEISDGTVVGFVLGRCDSATLGVVDGEKVGPSVGTLVGRLLGSLVGIELGLTLCEADASRIGSIKGSTTGESNNGGFVWVDVG